MGVRYGYEKGNKFLRLTGWRQTNRREQNCSRFEKLIIIKLKKPKFVKKSKQTESSC